VTGELFDGRASCPGALAQGHSSEILLAAKTKKYKSEMLKSRHQNKNSETNERSHSSYVHHIYTVHSVVLSARVIMDFSLCE